MAVIPAKFEASPGWCTRFMNTYRNGLALRTKTLITQKLPSDVEQKADSFHIHVYELNQIGNMDETTIILTSPKSQTHVIENKLTRQLHKIYKFNWRVSLFSISLVWLFGLYFDIPGNTTIDHKGNKTIYAKTTSHENTHFTVVCCVCQMAPIGNATAMACLTLRTRTHIDQPEPSFWCWTYGNIQAENHAQGEVYTRRNFEG